MTLIPGSADPRKTGIIALKRAILASATEWLTNRGRNVTAPPFDDEGFDEAFAGCRSDLKDLLGEDESLFTSMLYQTAGLIYLRNAEGTKAFEAKLFFIPVYDRTENLIDLAINPSTALKLAETFGRTGVIGPFDSVEILPGYLTTQGLRNLGPHELGQITRDLLVGSIVDESNDRFSSAVSQLLAKNGDGLIKSDLSKDSSKNIGRCLIGLSIRSRASLDEMTPDALDANIEGRRYSKEWQGLVAKEFPTLLNNGPCGILRAITTSGILKHIDTVATEKRRLNIAPQKEPSRTKVTQATGGVFLTSEFGAVKTATAYIPNEICYAYPKTFFNYLSSINADLTQINKRPM